MKSWQIALLLVVLVLGAGLALKATKPKSKASTPSKANNDILGTIIAFGSKALGQSTAGTKSGTVDLGQDIYGGDVTQGGRTYGTYTDKSSGTTDYIPRDTISDNPSADERIDPNNPFA